MAHVGQEFAFGAAGVFGRVLGLAQFGLTLQQRLLTLQQALLGQGALAVVSVGDSQSMAGRVLMIYAVAMVVLAPLTASCASNRQHMHWLVGGGLVIAGLGGVLMLAGAVVGWVFLAVLLVGLGQSMSISAQSALVREHCQPEIEQLGEGTV